MRLTVLAHKTRQVASGIIFGAALLGFSFTAQAQRLNVPDQIKFCGAKLRESIKGLSDTTRFPRKVEKGGTTWGTAKYTDWTGGFFAGQLWYMYEATNDIFWKRQAERWQAGLEPHKLVEWSHDVGFVMFCSYGNAYRITKEDRYKDILFTSANSVGKLFNPKVGTMRSWTWRKDWMHPTIIDNLMNLELLFWVGKNGGPRYHYENANTHVQTTMKNHVRPDFSSYHVINYDTVTGKVLDRKTDQGFGDNTTWSRGQAWGIYGFAMASRETRNIKYLETAKKMADYFLKRLPDDMIPYWDFQAPDIPNEERDASAAAVAACGLLEIAKLTKEPLEERRYKEAAIRILESLSKAPYTTAGTKNPAFIQQCVGSKPHKSEIDVSLVYADYYYLEALLRLTKWKE